MSLKIHPLAITQVHWPTLIKVCQEELGYSPTRGLDEMGIKPDAPSAFLGCINLDNQPLKQLRYGHYYGTAWKHVSASFIAVADAKVIVQITGICGLHVLPKRIPVLPKRIPDSDDFIIIITGNMCQWRNAILKGCRSQDRIYKPLREAMNFCLVYLQEAGFREVWHDCEKIGLGDNTFIVKKR
jgi:hypothetical protein